MKALCSEPNCGGIVQARGLCNYHYGRMRRAERPIRPRKKPKMHPASLANLQPQAETKARTRPPHPGANIPGFQEFLSLKATDNRDAFMARLQEEARKDPIRFPGGIVPWTMIPADPRPQQEIVRLTRIPGGKGIRRC